MASANKVPVGRAVPHQIHSVHRLSTLSPLPVGCQGGVSHIASFYIRSIAWAINLDRAGAVRSPNHGMVMERHKQRSRKNEGKELPKPSYHEGKEGRPAMEKGNTASRGTRGRNYQAGSPSCHSHLVSCSGYTLSSCIILPFSPLTIR